MTDGLSWQAAIAEVRAKLESLRADRPLPTVDKSFIHAPTWWRRSEDDEAELVPLYAVRDILDDLEARGPKPSQANIDGYYDGIQRGIGDGLRTLEHLTTTDPVMIAWRERSITNLKDLIRKAARHDPQWRR